MIREKELSKTSFYFEMFIERAYNKYEPYSPGFYALMMENLIVAEKGKIISVETITRFEKQLIEIKEYMEEALDSYITKTSIPIELIDELKRCKEQVVWAVSSEELDKIILYTIDLIVNVPIKMEY